MNFFLKNSLPKFVKETPSLNKSLSILKRLYPLSIIPIDHIAFRSFFSDMLQEKFSKMNYVEQGSLSFAKKDIKAKWYSLESGNIIYPKIFLSEYNTEKLPKDLQKKIYSKYDSKVYLELKELSQYAAWTYKWKNEINHVAFSTHNLPISIEEIYDILKENEMPVMALNKSQDKLLTQFSIKSDKVDGINKSFVEFIERKPDLNRMYSKCHYNKKYTFIEEYLNSSIHEFERKVAFEETNAIKIFESTK